MGKNLVYIACSLDGYIADKQGRIDFLDKIPIPEGTDMGFYTFMDRVDALVMGRNTFETVMGFDIEWPYKIPVLVVSYTMQHIPESHQQHAQLIKGTPQEIRKIADDLGYNDLYIDGGATIQGFLKEGMIDEMIITTVPVLLGGGASLFGELVEPQWFKLEKSEVICGDFVHSTYVRRPE